MPAHEPAQPCAQRDCLPLLTIDDAESVVDGRDVMAADEEGAPVRRPPVTHVDHDRAVLGRRPPVPVRVVAGVDRRQSPVEQRQRACLTVVVRQNHRVGAERRGVSGGMST
jgi:hypothetical protein